jgi:hypothetical protein
MVGVLGREGRRFFFFFLAVVKFELRASHLLGRPSPTWATPLVHGGSSSTEERSQAVIQCSLECIRTRNVLFRGTTDFTNIPRLCFNK